MKKLFIILASFVLVLYLSYLAAGFFYAQTITDEKATRLAILYSMCEAKNSDEMRSAEFLDCVQRAKGYIARRDINFFLETELPFLSPVLIQQQFK